PTLSVVVGAGNGPVRLGLDQVELLDDGARATARLAAAIRRARGTVHAEIYELDREELVSALAEARHRGVEVDVVADPSVAGNAEALTRLREAGVDVALFPDGPRQIDHVKLLVVDAVQAIFGGVNWGARSYLNHDFDLSVVGPAAACLERVFTADRIRSGRVASLGTLPSCAANPGLRLLTTYPDDLIGPAAMSLIESARRWVFVEMYVLTDPDVLAALQAAARRGLVVFVLLDPAQ